MRFKQSLSILISNVFIVVSGKWLIYFLWTLPQMSQKQMAISSQIYASQITHPFFALSPNLSMCNSQLLYSLHEDICIALHTNASASCIENRNPIFISPDIEAFLKVLFHVSVLWYIWYIMKYLFHDIWKDFHDTYVWGENDWKSKIWVFAQLRFAYFWNAVVSDFSFK